MQITSTAICLSFLLVYASRVYFHKLLLCRNATSLQLTIWGSTSKLAAGQMASPSRQRTVGVRHETRGRETGFESQHKGVNQSSTQDWVTEGPVFGSLTAVEMVGI